MRMGPDSPKQRNGIYHPFAIPALPLPSLLSPVVPVSSLPGLCRVAFPGASVPRSRAVRVGSSLSRSLGAWAVSFLLSALPVFSFPSRSLSPLAACSCPFALLLPASVPPAPVRCNRPACPLSVPLAAAFSLASCLSPSLLHRSAPSSLAQQWHSLAPPCHPHGLQGAQSLQRCLNRITAAT